MLEVKQALQQVFVIFIVPVQFIFEFRILKKKVPEYEQLRFLVIWFLVSFEFKFFPLQLLINAAFQSKDSKLLTILIKKHYKHPTASSLLLLFNWSPFEFNDFQHLLMIFHIVLILEFSFVQAMSFIALNQSSLGIVCRVLLLLVIFRVFLNTLFLFQVLKFQILFYVFLQVLQVLLVFQSLIKKLHLWD